MTKRTFHLWEVFGVELEYMIVDANTLDVRPIADEVMREVAGEYVAEVELGEISWSNELALHVIELKTNGPAAALESLVTRFQEHVGHVNACLGPRHARLMPTAMHPWMDPHRELKLWPHEYNPVYETYNRIFDCRGHGWANLQSVHLNLPFADDEEFGRLHAGIRLLTPILPALAASSPVIDRKLTGVADNRLEAYRQNSRRVPSVTAQVIPEPVYARATYEQQIFQRMYDDMAPLDPAGVLRHEWLNARGAIARFDRNTIEIRVLDVQECPTADLAICAAIVAALRELTQERWTGVAEQQSFAVEPLAHIFRRVIRQADQAVIEGAEYLAQFGVQAARISAQELWQHLHSQVSSLSPNDDALDDALQTILQQGPLSRRIERALGGNLERMADVYRELCDCLSEGRMFAP